MNGARKKKEQNTDESRTHTSILSLSPSLSRSCPVSLTDCLSVFVCALIIIIKIKKKKRVCTETYTRACSIFKFNAKKIKIRTHEIHSLRLKRRKNRFIVHRGNGFFFIQFSKSYALILIDLIISYFFLMWFSWENSSPFDWIPCSYSVNLSQNNDHQNKMCQLINWSWWGTKQKQNKKKIIFMNQKTPEIRMDSSLTHCLKSVYFYFFNRNLCAAFGSARTTQSLVFVFFLQTHAVSQRHAQRTIIITTTMMVMMMYQTQCAWFNLHICDWVELPYTLHIYYLFFLRYMHDAHEEFKKK